MPTRPENPSVSVIMAVYNEAEFIDDTISDLLGQDYEGPLEVIVADGGSTDGTKEMLQKWAEGDDRLMVVDNPQRRQAFGLNLAADRANGTILVRADGHTRFASDYVASCVQVLEETEGAVGGRMEPVGITPFGRLVASAMRSSFTMGPGRFHHATTREVVDTVYLGAFSADRFRQLGGFRSFPSGAAEDADFFYRWRGAGGVVYVDPSISSTYAPRDTPGALWRQYFRYGMGKSEMLWVNGRWPSLRPLAPLALVLGLITFGVFGFVSHDWWPLLLLLGLWLLGLGVVGAVSGESVLGVMLVSAAMHIAYGIGQMWGLVGSVADARVLRESDSTQG